MRHRHNWLLLFRFALVGASGVVVNLATLVLVKRLGPDPDDPIIGLPFSDYNVRWYHVYSTIAFLVANLWNFQLNRSWTFRKGRHKAWWRNMRRELLDARANGEVFPLRRLNNAFRGPSVLFAYYQSGLLCQMLIEEHGFPPMVRLLERYGGIPAFDCSWSVPIPIFEDA